MKISSPYRTVLQSILSGSYTPTDVREFVRVCYLLALPLIRKRIVQGRIDLESLGLKQPDLVYDCIADLFVRDRLGHFTEVEKFFAKEVGDPSRCSDALLFDTLRRIVFGRANNNLIRLHSEADPSFGKILHNLDVTIARTNYFEKFVRFGESMLACCEAELLLDRSPASFDYLREQLARVVLVHDSMPVMLKKLHDVLEGQGEFQRTVPFLWVVTFLKEIYVIGAEGGPESQNLITDHLEVEDALRLVQGVCAELRAELHPHYVGKGKITEELFETYLRTTSEILSDSVSVGRDGQKHFYEYLTLRMPGVSKEEYISRHKPILEYFVKVAKQKLAKELRKDRSAQRPL